MKDLSEQNKGLAPAIHDYRLEAEELATAAAVGQATLGIAHNLGNCLNSMMLQASIVEMKVPEELKDEVRAIRKQGTQAAALLRPLQRLRQQGMEHPYPVDFKLIWQQVAEEKAKEGAWISLKLAEDLPSLNGTRALCLALARCVYDEVLKRARTSQSRILLETKAKPGGGEITFSVLSDESTRQARSGLFGPMEEFFAGKDEVEVVATRTILKLLGMKIRTANEGKGKESLHLEW
jgi:hypothetical protein